MRAHLVRPRVERYCVVSIVTVERFLAIMALYLTPYRIATDQLTFFYASTACISRNTDTFQYGCVRLRYAIPWTVRRLEAVTIPTV